MARRRRAAIDPSPQGQLTWPEAPWDDPGRKISEDWRWHFRNQGVQERHQLDSKNLSPVWYHEHSLGGLWRRVTLLLRSIGIPLMHFLAELDKQCVEDTKRLMGAMNFFQSEPLVMAASSGPCQHLSMKTHFGHWWCYCTRWVPCVLLSVAGTQSPSQERPGGCSEGFEAACSPADALGYRRVQGFGVLLRAAL